jgi:hypothetical protein
MVFERLAREVEPQFSEQLQGGPDAIKERNQALAQHFRNAADYIEHGDTDGFMKEREAILTIGSPEHFMGMAQSKREQLQEVLRDFFESNNMSDPPEDFILQVADTIRAERGELQPEIDPLQSVADSFGITVEDLKTAITLVAEQKGNAQLEVAEETPWDMSTTQFIAGRVVLKLLDDPTVDINELGERDVVPLVVPDDEIKKAGSIASVRGRLSTGWKSFLNGRLNKILASESIRQARFPIAEDILTELQMPRLQDLLTRVGQVSQYQDRTVADVLNLPPLKEKK